jgi:endonuclease VIII
MEGPSLVILREEAQDCIGKLVTDVSGNSKIDQSQLLNQYITGLKSWGKHFLIFFDNDIVVRIHFLMFGSYRINEEKPDTQPRLSLTCKGIQLNFYTCSIKMVSMGELLKYDWSVDVMSDEWDAKKAIRKLKKQPDTMICDALLDQDIFAGVGNIIKNEVLFRTRLHPEKLIKDFSSKELESLVQETRNYCFDFYKWKKVYMLRKNWLIYKKMKCRNCGEALTRKHTGKGQRYSWFCAKCQK